MREAKLNMIVSSDEIVVQVIIYLYVNQELALLVAMQKWT